LTRIDDPAFAAAYRLLRRSFPKRELVSMREWRDTLAERGARLWTDIAWHLIVAVRGDRLVGVATGNYLGK
jgi:hypothetical protein